MYQKSIKQLLLEVYKRTDIDPRHVEGYMRLQHSTLDGLSKKQFAEEVEIGIMCVDMDGIKNAEQNALSYAL